MNHPFYPNCRLQIAQYIMPPDALSVDRAGDAQRAPGRQHDQQNVFSGAAQPPPDPHAGKRYHRPSPNSPPPISQPQRAALYGDGSTVGAGGSGVDVGSSIVATAVGAAVAAIVGRGVAVAISVARTVAAGETVAAAV